VEDLSVAKYLLYILYLIISVLPIKKSTKIDFFNHKTDYFGQKINSNALAYLKGLFKLKLSITLKFNKIGKNNNRQFDDFLRPIL